MKKEMWPSREILSLLIISCVATLTCGLKCHVTCKRENVEKQLHKVFSASLLLNGSSVSWVDDQSAQRGEEMGTVAVHQVSGKVTKDQAYLYTELSVECVLTEFLECQLFGLSLDMEKFTKIVFIPEITFDAGVTNMNSHIQPAKEVYSPGDTVLVHCSADVGSKEDLWKVRAAEEELERRVNTSLIGSACVYHSTVTSHYTINSTTPTSITCMYGETTVVGTFLLNSFNVHESLSFHLFLSSIALVYCPFVFMPMLWCSCSAGSKTWRNPESLFFKGMRSGISLLDFILFVVWWSFVYYKYQTWEQFKAYATFAVVETVFILGYALYRCFFPYLEQKGNWFGEQRAYNSRVTSSHGAVMTPVICWLMIRVPNSLPWCGLEVLFWIISVACILIFAFVSHRREHDDWGKKKD